MSGHHHDDDHDQFALSASIPSQNPIENVASKVPDLESKQRFSEDSEWSTLGALKMP